ncbi:VOC family protein [Flagellimonas nanhaiensis]|uniref:VOC family protein n=1 Tax=Flagellimonas nanhaiensis TaxID=2292706 RepID=A0A371JVE6_9FLAO|nr:VOC family protein [Allomuricauda nanhaiensis]RDY61756.1 VOC family protein [Allomuricauda nanhaiensis]
MKNSKRSIAHVTLVVREYNEAIEYYTQKLGFELIQDIDLGDGKRWVLVSPKDSDCKLVLGKADSEKQQSAIGNQTGGRVFLFLHTSDFWSDYNAMKQKGVVFTEEPREEAYGTVVVFKDLYGNLWDLLQLK